MAGLLVGDELGGFGASDVEAGVVLSQHGYYLAATPLRAHWNAVMVLDECLQGDARQALLSSLVDGELLAGVVFDDLDHTINFTDDKKTLISGRFARVPFGASLDVLYFQIEVDGTICLARLNCGTADVSQTLTPSIDQTQILGAIECTNSPLEIVAKNIGEPFARAKARATVAACNEMVGTMKAILNMAVQYSKDRNQFGRPIGSFQAIKHKLADMLLETESSESIALYGSWLASMGKDFFNEDLEDDIEHIASMAKYYCSKALSNSAGENLQIHGGIGFTMESDVQLYFKRAAFMNAYLGMPSEHSKVLASKIF
ncbi:MAG TPA: acyl-CoA dehydrogenase [Acidimicrobiia bacterium]|nr:acyl-CoA dehydrogenase [Acidimicrobiia bacterium]